MPNLLDITDRVAVVMGGTSGLGRAIAIGLAQHGAHVIPSGRREEQMKTACDEIRALGRRTLVRTCDVTDRDLIDSLRDAVLKEFGRVDIIVNAAGFTFREPTATMDEGRWTGLIDT